MRESAPRLSPTAIRLPLVAQTYSDSLDPLRSSSFGRIRNSISATANIALGAQALVIDDYFCQIATCATPVRDVAFWSVADSVNMCLGMAVIPMQLP